jgi:hypothetical protein
MAMSLLYRIAAASGSTHFSSPPYRAGHSNAVSRKAKVYQVRQVRAVLLKYRLAGEGGED